MTVLSATGINLSDYQPQASAVQCLVKFYTVLVTSMARSCTLMAGLVRALTTPRLTRDTMPSGDHITCVRETFSQMA